MHNTSRLAAAAAAVLAPSSRRLLPHRRVAVSARTAAAAAATTTAMCRVATTTRASASTVSALSPSALCVPRRTLYSALVEDHYAHPRNVGKLDKNDPNVGTGLRGAPECGDMTQMQVKINPDTLVIEDVKFKAFGCGSAIAASSYASQAIRGKTLADALQLTNKQIAQELSLPPVKLHCSMLAEETIHAAVENYLSKNPTLKSKVKRGAHAASAAPATATHEPNGNRSNHNNSSNGSISSNGSSNSSSSAHDTTATV